MKRTKALILLLICSVLLSIVSCENTSAKRDTLSQSGALINSDDPWFEGTVIDVDLGIEPSRKVNYIFPRLAGADDSYIYVFINGEYFADWDKVVSNSDFAIKNISVIDRKSKETCKTINLYTLLEPTDWPDFVIYSENKLIVKCESWQSDTDTYYKRDYYIDPNSETIIKTVNHELNENQQYCDSYNISNYRVETMYNFGSEKSFCSLKVYSPEGNVSDVEIKNSNEEYFDIPVVIAIDDVTALIPVVLARGYKYYKMDLATCKITECNTNEFEWLDINQLINSYSASDGKIYYTTTNGISMLDIKNKTDEQVFDYNCCDVNRQYMAHLDIAECSEDTFLLCGQYNSTNMFTSMFVNSFAIVEFKKAEKNPHSGKRILELYTPNGKVDGIISDAIIKYNNNNDKYFIKLSDRYNRSDYLDYSEVSSLDEYDTAQLTANAQLSNELAMDLMNGVGPDILLNTSDLGQLNNDNYLVDLGPYFTYLESDKYFTNIVDGAKTEDKLYQLPISFTIEGIQTAPEYAGHTGYGFTTNEYNEFLYKVLNGKDVIESGQSLYFVKLFNGMSDAFIVKGKVDFTGSEFAEIAGYVKDNVKQNSISWDMITDENIESIDYTSKGNRIAYYCNCPGISGYLVKRAQIKNGTAILGIPSSDGRGPMFGTDISVAISTQAYSIDACVEFVKLLISDDVQNELVMSDKFVLNRDSFKLGCSAAIEYFNTEEGSQNMFDYAAGTYVTSHMKFTSDDIDNLESIIMSCSKIDSADSAINAILLEEMPAYFLEQKELDSVVTIIQDRAQKVLDERG